MNLVDSCGWIEYLADSPKAGFYAPAVCNAADLIVPTVCIFEVYKHVLRRRDEDAALEAVAAMRRGWVVDLDLDTALSAAEVGLDTGLPLADSIILATARAHDAVLWTQDAHFEGIEGVRYTPA